MAHISKINLEKLAGRSDTLELKLNRSVNVFFGANGSGKTSLLRAIHSALSNDSKLLSRIPLASGLITIEDAPVDHPEWLIFEQTITRTTTYRQRELFEEAAAILGSSPQQRKVWASSSSLEESHDAGQSIEHVYLPITRLYATDDQRTPIGLKRRLEGTGQLLEADLDSIFVEAINLLWLRYTRNLLADVRNAQESGLNNILINVITSESSQTEAPQISDPKIAYERLISFLNRQESLNFSFGLEDEEDFVRRLQQSGLIRNVVSEIERVEKTVEQAQRPRNQFERLLRSMISGNKSLELENRDIHFRTGIGDEVKLGDLSSGEKQLLRICVEALLAGDNPIIIDEPELSMHIDWQRRLVRALQTLSPNSQLIVATHSPEVMAELDEDSIFEI